MLMMLQEGHALCLGCEGLDRFAAWENTGMCHWGCMQGQHNLVFEHLLSIL